MVGERVLEEKVNWRRSYWVKPVLSVNRARAGEGEDQVGDDPGVGEAEGEEGGHHDGVEEGGGALEVHVSTRVVHLHNY